MYESTLQHMPVDGKLHTYRCGFPISQAVHFAVGSPTPLSSHLKKMSAILTQSQKQQQRGRTVGTHFPVIILHMFTVLFQMNVTSRMDSNNIGLKSDLHRLDAIHKEKEGKAFP
jgi:hypothetical protein